MLETICIFEAANCYLECSEVHYDWDLALLSSE